MSGGAEAALWICISALWIYMPIDALRTAQAKRAGLPLSDPLDNFSRQRPIGPIILNWRWNPALAQQFRMVSVVPHLAVLGLSF